MSSIKADHEKADHRRGRYTTQNPRDVQGGTDGGFPSSSFPEENGASILPEAPECWEELHT